MKQLVPPKDLVAAARKALKNAYAPYSQFCVGAAVRAYDGKIYAGCNVENASYGGTICAERVAIFNAISAGHKRIREVLILTPTDSPCPPCGFCRQVMSEFCRSTTSVWMVTDRGHVKKSTLQKLLPLSFGRRALMKG